MKLKTWEESFEIAKDYCKENNCSRIPVNVKHNGSNIGKWFRQQVSYYNTGALPVEKIKLMEDSGMKLTSHIEDDWWEHYSMLLEFYETHPDKVIMRDDVYKDWKIGNWTWIQRDFRNKGKLSQDKIAALDKAGFLWWENKIDINWLKTYNIVKDFFESTYINYVPKDVIWNNVNIYEWSHYQNRSYRENTLADWKIKLLEEINYSFKSPKSIHSSKEEATIFFYLRPLFPFIRNRDCSNGFELDLYIEQDGKKIGIEYDGYYYHKDSQDKDRKKIENCEKNNVILFNIRHKSCKSLSPDTEYYHEYLLSDDNRDEYKSEQFKNALEKVIKDICKIFNIVPNIDINIKRDSQEIVKEHIKFFDSKWINNYNQVKDFYIKYGKIPTSKNPENQKYRSWLNNQRDRYKNNKMPANEVKLLEALRPYGFYWNIEELWDKHYNLFIEYKKEYNTAEVKQHFEYRNYNLGKWVSAQREKYNNNILSQDKIDKLNAAGFKWESSYSPFITSHTSLDEKLSAAEAKSLNQSPITNKNHNIER